MDADDGCPPCTCCPYAYSREYTGDYARSVGLDTLTEWIRADAARHARFMGVTPPDGSAPVEVHYGYAGGWTLGKVRQPPTLDTADYVLMRMEWIL